MKKIIDSILDFPKIVNEKLPQNCFNEMLDNSENSIKKWTGDVFRLGAFVILIVTLISIILDGIDSFYGNGLEIVNGILCMLILIYASFPISQIIRNVGDSLSNSKSNIVDFIFKEFITQNIKAIGHITALIALFGAICSTVSWILNTGSLESLSIDLYDGFSYAYALPANAVAQLLDILNLGFVSSVINDFLTWDLTGSTASGYNIESVISLGWEYIQVILILAKLYLSLAIYHFIYNILTTLTAWIQKPYLPFKNL